MKDYRRGARGTLKAPARGVDLVCMGPVATQPATALSGVPGPAHELRTLILSRHPAIVIETAEEERVDALLAAVCPELRLGRFAWTVTKGLRRVPDAGAAYESDDPAKALAAIGEMAPEAVFELRDFSRYLDKPELSRAFRELLARLSAPSRMSTVVLVGARIELPAEVEPHVVRLELNFPSHDEYRRTLSAVTDSLSLTGRAHVEVGASELDGFARAVSGMTLNQARQAVARVAIEDGRLSADDMGRIAGLKAEALKHDGLLEFWPPADNNHELGGFASLERWLDRARVGFSEQAAELNLTPPRGVLLVGVQGCGKSLAAKAIARRWQLPLLKLDAGRLYDKYIGETERNLRRAIGTAESMAPAVLWIDEIEKAFATGGGGDNDGGLSRRVLGTFLTWLQEKRAPVFVVATANDCRSCRRSCCARGASTRSSSSTCPTPTSGPRSSPSTWGCADRTRRPSTRHAWWRPARGSRARRSSRL